MEDRGETFASMVKEGRLDLPLPGSGATWERWERLAEIAAFDLSVARLSEGHTDAMAILDEAGNVPPTNGRLGVWAAGPLEALQATEGSDGWRLDGRRRWCSGASILTHALVTAGSPGGPILVLVDLRQPGVSPRPGSWPAVGMADSDTLDVRFDDVAVPAGDQVGDFGFYAGRPGFAVGAVGVAAVWWGGAIGVAQALGNLAPDGDPHRLAHRGAVEAGLWSMRTVLREAARRVDADPTGDHAITAAIVRHLVEAGASEVLTRTGRATGADPLGHNRAHAQRVADLTVYLRQHHAESDLAALGRMLAPIVPGQVP
jgi:alkylation response protein AidB-like acyl-CoA dehydrogenase